MYTNIQSVCSKINELAVHTVDQQPDIILLTETWCNASVPDAALAIPGYHLETDLRMDRTDTTNGIGGGLLVYTKLGLRILSTDKFKLNKFNQFCCFQVITKGEPLSLILVYRPPGSGHDNIEELCDIMRNLDNQSIVIGDVNLPEINWPDLTSAARGRPVLRTAIEESLEQLVNFAPEAELGRVLREYGEERHWKGMARSRRSAASSTYTCDASLHASSTQLHTHGA